MKKHNSEIVLSNLLSGGSLKDENQTYFLSECNSLCIEAVKIKNGIEEDILLPVDISFKTFLNICEKISEADIFLMSTETSLRNNISKKFGETDV